MNDLKSSATSKQLKCDQGKIPSLTHHVDVRWAMKKYTTTPQNKHGYPKSKPYLKGYTIQTPSCLVLVSMLNFMWAMFFFTILVSLIPGFTHWAISFCLFREAPSIPNTPSKQGFCLSVTSGMLIHKAWLQLSYEKNLPTFHYTGWFTGILILA